MVHGDSRKAAMFGTRAVGRAHRYLAAIRHLALPDPNSPVVSRSLADHARGLTAGTLTRGRRNNGSTKIKGEQRTADQLLEQGASDAGAYPVIVGHFVHEPK